MLEWLCGLADVNQKNYKSEYYVKKKAHGDEVAIIWMSSQNYVGCEVWGNHSVE